MPRPPQFFEVPKKTQPRPCASCRATVYWIITPAGKRMPIDCDTARVLARTGEPGAVAPTVEQPGRGISHFVTCKDAELWRKRA
jgi:hypothetical protein